MANWPNYPCTNPSCASYGKSHPNCKCQPPEGHYAEGGAVHYCVHNKAHEESCEHYASGGEVRGNQEFQDNPDLAIDHAIAQNGLLHTITRTGFTKSNEPGRAHSEFLDASRRGRKTLQGHSDSMLESKSHDMKIDHERGHALEQKLIELSSNPELAMQIGGNLGDTLPAHHALLAAKMANAATYLNSIKPKPTQAGPLDNIIPPTQHQEKGYKRQLAIAEDPKLIFQHAKDRALIPQDIQTLSTLYPKLKTSIADRAFETLATAKMNGKNLTHHQKRKLGALIGEPMTYLQTPAASQAILKANAPMQPLPAPAKPGKKASGTELKQINKVNELSETPLQKLQTARNS